MKCPFCESTEMTVSNSRETNRGYSTWRRRKCIGCGSTFTTYEKVDLNYIIVEKKSSSRERYSHYKLYGSILNAFMKIKDVDTGDCAKNAEICTTEVEKFLTQKKLKEISSSQIFEIVLSILLQKDIRVAMNYFSYFHPKSKNEEIENLLKQNISTPSH